MTPSPQILKAVRDSRLEIAQEYKGLISELDVQKKIKHSFKQHPFFWLSGAVSAGLLTTLFGVVKRPSPKTVATEATTLPSPALETAAKLGWLASALEIGKFLYPILKPVVLDFANKSLQSSLTKKAKL